MGGPISVDNFNSDLKLDAAVRAEVNASVGGAYERMDYRPQAVAMIVNRTRKRMLMVMSPKAIERGNWSLVQGGIDRGEDVIEALCREVGEELGIGEGDFDVVGFAGSAAIAGRTKGGFSEGKAYHNFILEVDDEVDLRPDPNEIAAVRWIDREDIPNYVGTMREERQRLVNAILAGILN